MTAQQARELVAALRAGGIATSRPRVFPATNHLCLADSVGYWGDSMRLPSPAVRREVPGELPEWVSHPLFRR